MTSTTPVTSSPANARVDRISRVIKGWADDLVDRSARNNLLYLKPDGASVLRLEAVQPGVQARLLAGDKLRLSDIFTDTASQRAAARKAQTIHNRAKRAFDEWGFSSLHLALHAVTWPVASDRPRPCAPVLLCPVHVTPRAKGKDFDIELEPGWELNEALRLALADDHSLIIDQGALIPGSGSSPDPDLCLTEAQRQIGATPTLSVEPLLVMTNFAYSELPIVRDLQEHVEDFARSDLIARLTGEPMPVSSPPQHGLDRDGERPEVTTRLAPLLIRAADSSQETVINHVLEGDNVVVEGPPGTGKSQTIANLIGALIAEGRTVLFVAEKRAAIDAVAKHFDDVGLADLIFDLHDGVSSRRAVAQRLRDALESTGQVPAPDFEAEDDLLARASDHLTRASELLHQQHGAWGVSLWHAFERALRSPPSQRPNLRISPTRPVHVRELAGLTEAMNDFTDRDLGLRLAVGDSPWSFLFRNSGNLSQDDLGTIASQLQDLRYDVLPRLIAEARATLAASGLRGPDTIRSWSEAIALADAVALSLGRLHRAAFDLDLETLSTELASTTSLGRLLFGRKRQLVRQAQALAHGESARPLAELVDWFSQAACTQSAWRAAAPGYPYPSHPLEIEAVRESWIATCSLTATLSSSLGGDLADLSIDAAADRVRELSDDGDALLALARLKRSYRNLADAGFQPLLDALTSGWRGPTTAVDDLEYLWATAMVERLLPALAGGGNSRGFLDRAVADFRQRDQQHVASAPHRIRRRWAERVHALTGTHQDQHNVLTAASRRAGVAPSQLRTLLRDSPDLLLGLLPCWAMSPLVVSELLPSVEGLFDVVIFDEASQVKPVHALPTLLRGRQVVVAGDDKQLPPTSFFDLGADDRDDDDDSNDLVASVSSVLDLLAAMPGNKTIQLLWHYRSQDERLIAFCNARPDLYRGRLVTFPGVMQAPPLQHVRVDGPATDRHTSPQVEVDQVMELIVEHLHTAPEESLGVITLGKTHQDRIESALRSLEADLPALALWMASQREPLFIKNIETVQGDERDRIILSVGLGRSPDGRLLNRLGAINNEVGVRRLNVALSRARKQMTIVTCFDGAEMGRFAGDGAVMLREFLSYVNHGGLTETSTTARSAELNGFERDVARVLDERGIPYRAQHGVSGFFLDFALLHHKRPGHFVLAVEADGDRYHRSGKARDRDRLRQEHLERLGWRFHRIWSTEWYRQRDNEILALLQAYEQAIAVADRNLTTDLASSADLPLGLTEDRPRDDPADLVVPARGSRPPVPQRSRIEDYAFEELVQVVQWIQSDTLLRPKEALVQETQRELGFKRLGSRIRAAIERAIDETDTRP